MTSQKKKNVSRGQVQVRLPNLARVLDQFGTSRTKRVHGELKHYGLSTVSTKSLVTQGDGFPAVLQ